MFAYRLLIACCCFILAQATAESEELPVGYHCRQPPDAGRCTSPEIRWAYDVNNRLCKEFISNGCLGNLNNFPTKSDCELMCSKFKPCPEIPVGCLVIDRGIKEDGCRDLDIRCSKKRFQNAPTNES